MTYKQKRFCEEYLIDTNGTQAAIRAGYSKKTARQIADRLLSKGDIKTYIDDQLDKIHNDKIADATEVMKYLTSVLRGESYSSVLSLCGDGCQEIVDKLPDEKEKLKAAELLGKRYGIFTDKMKMEVEPVVIVNDLTE